MKHSNKQVHERQKQRTYKVWICVEEHDPATETYQDLDLPFGHSGEFENEEQAVEFAKTLFGIGAHEGIAND